MVIDSQLLLSQLPPVLRERSRFYGSSAHHLPGKFVLYWLRTAMRAHENPALDVARLIAHRHQLPLLVYQGLSEDYRYASDRHQTFILQGARDLQQQLAAAGVSYAFALTSRRDDKPYLLWLAQRAALTVTEDMPVDPPRFFLRALARQLGTPILCVDTACVVPMRTLGRAYTRAFEFRDATQRSLPTASGP